MRRALAVLMATVLLAAAKPTGPSVFVVQDTRYQPVEQQGVRNDTTCSWDYDDAIRATVTGTFAPGESFSYSDCVITDWIAHDLWIVPAAGLTGYVSTDGRTGTCLMTHEWDHEDPLPPVGAGVGVEMAVTWTLRNDTSRTIRKGVSYLYLGPRGSCS